jgi:polygalacturonase
MIYNILDFGAIGDGIQNDAPAIQKAVDACSRSGGGRVLIPEGKVFKAGSIVLKTNVELHLEQGSFLKASDSLEDYHWVDGINKISQNSESKVLSYVNCEYNGKPFQYFIYAKDEKNISITGPGKIDGTEELYYGEIDQYHIEGSYYPRIPMMLLENIKNLIIKDVTLARSGFWTVHMAGCYDVLIDGIKILNNLKMANADGIDPDHCKNVRIINCYLECADDCIVFKNTKAFEQYGDCENIFVYGCTMISTSSALKFGTESENNFHNILVENCTINRSNRGISLQLRDCGNIENVKFSNIKIETRKFSNQWWGSAEPIYITAIDRKDGVKAGHIKNIQFENIHCNSENGIFILGSEDNHIENITFDNILLSMKKISKWDIYGNDTRPCAHDGIVERKINGLFVKYAKNIKARNLKIHIDDSMKAFMGDEIESDQVENINI